MDLILNFYYLVRKQGDASRDIDLDIFLNLECNWDVCLKACDKATVHMLEKQGFSPVAQPDQFSYRRLNQSLLVILR